MQALRCLAILALGSAAPVAARAAPPPEPPAAAQPDALKAAFEALPEADRRALQEALIWTGDFNGAVAGSYGPRTRDALLAYARRSGIAPAAALDAAGRRPLLAAAEAARRAVGFVLLRDPRAGLAIGVPVHLLPGRSPLPDGTRYAAPDGSAVLDTAGRPGSPEALADAFARLTRDAPGRRVTYKLARPDFIVVTGETGDRKFYSRYALATPPGGEAMLRGFTLTYPGGAPDVDRLVLAVAAAFDPQPPAPQAPAGAAAASAAAPEAKLPAAAPVLVGAAVLVAPGLALTRADQRLCRDPTVDGAPARWARQDPASGLALLAVADRAGVPAPVLSAAAPPAPRYGLFFVPVDGGATLSVALAADAAPGRAGLPLQGADAGVPLVDGTGALWGLTAARDDRPPSAGGVVVAASYAVADAGQIAAFLRAAGVVTGSAGADPAAGIGVLLARWRPAVLPLRCRAPA